MTRHRWIPLWWALTLLWCGIPLAAAHADPAVDPQAGWETTTPNGAIESPQMVRGMVRATERAVISSRLTAQIAKLPFRAGDSFKKGDVLAKFDCGLYSAERDKVEAELKAARMKRNNLHRLAALGSAGELEVGLAGTDVQQAQAELKVADLNVQRCTITAPYDGRVVRLMVNDDETVHPQQDLMEIVGTGKLEAEIIVPGTWLRWLKVGTRLSMKIDETGADIGGTISGLGAAIDPVSHSATVRAQLLDTPPSLLPGMSGAVQFQHNPAAAAVTPRPKPPAQAGT